MQLINIDNHCIYEKNKTMKDKYEQIYQSFFVYMLLIMKFEYWIIGKKILITNK